MNVNALTGIDGTLLTTAADQADRTANNNFTNYMNQSLSYGDYLEQIFQKASMTYNVSKDLLKAMAKAESNFRADATSHCGAMGIMQLMPGTAASLGVTDAYNPEQNIMGGAKYISRLLEKYNGNLSYAVAAYNAGSGNVDKYGGIPPFNETQNYVVKVLQYLEEGVTIPDSSAAAGSNAYNAGSAASAGLQSVMGTSGADSTLQQMFNKYFDYDVYLEFLQLFTRVIYEKLTGTELGTVPDDQTKDTDQNKDQNAVQQEQKVETPVQPAKVLTMKVKDAHGRVNTYQQDEASKDEAFKAFEYMTAGGQNRMSIILNKTV